MPVSGSGRAVYEPIWAEDVADAVMGALSNGASGSYDLAGPRSSPTTTSCGRRCGRAGGAGACCTCRCRWCGLLCEALRLVAGPKVFATWEEAELMEEPMVSERGTADIEKLGVSPLSMPAVLGV